MYFVGLCEDLCLLSICGNQSRIAQQVPTAATMSEPNFVWEKPTHTKAGMFSSRRFPLAKEI